MADLPIVTAVSNSTWETAFVTAVEGSHRNLAVVRRCVDVADLLATAVTGIAKAVVLSSELRRLDASAVSRLHACGLHIVALAPEGDEDAERRARQIGISRVLPTSSEPGHVVELLAELAATPEPSAGPVGVASGADALTTPGGFESAPAGALRPIVSPGTLPQSYTVTSRVIAIWGPTGAPGRTTVAVGVADEAARAGVPTLLVDADSYGGVIAQHLGMLDEAPGIAAAARAHHHGVLDVPTLAGYGRQIDRNLSVLTGISRADRWPELRGEAVVGVLELSKRLARLVVVDCGFCLEDDEELSYDTAAPRRNAATLAALGMADRIVAVGSADPVGVARLVRGLSELAERVNTVAARAPVVVMNRLRATAMPGDPVKELTRAMQRFAGVDDLAFIPYDRVAADRAASIGRTFGDAAPRSALSIALGELTVMLLSAAPAPVRVPHT
ncbi:MAG TPA: hypothetical protein VHU91_07825 [Mycobacteriales bacterium]|nr:hypothetical protein [Mycobacteriales bacterium]